MLYFIDSKALINDHTQNQFKDKNVIVYLLFFYIQSVILSALFPGSKDLPQTGFIFEVLFFTVLFGIFFAFIFKMVMEQCWQANGGPSSQNFMNRLISLAWVFQFKAGLILMPLMILFKIVQNTKDSSFILPMAGLVVIAGLYGFYYIVQNIKKSLRQIYELTKVNGSIG